MVAKAAKDRRSSSSTNAMGNSTSNSKRRVPSGSQEKKKIAKPIGICGFCLGNDEKNANGFAEEMIHCAECGNSGHPSCLQYSDRLVSKIRSIRWQCIDCKSCIVCNQSDDSLLFCDFCDCGIHPKCCDPPLENIPKGDFACHLCRPDVLNQLNVSPKKSFVKTLSSSSIRSRRSLNLEEVNEKDSLSSPTRPIVSLHDGVSNFFLTKKQKVNVIRQNSVQKAMKYLREKKTTKLLKRLHSPTLEMKSRKENIDLKNQIIAETIRNSSKTSRPRKKTNNINGGVLLNPQTSTPLTTRQSTGKKPFVVESMTPSPTRVIRRSETHPIDEPAKISSNQRKQSTNSISPISSSSSTMKKRSRQESPSKKILLKGNHKKRKESKTEDDLSDENEIDDEKKSSNNKRKLQVDFSKYKNPPAFLKDPLPDTITENDVYLFLDARNNSTKLITECSDQYHHSSESIGDESTNSRWPPYIVLGSDLIKTWYSSSYPQEYARVPRLYICEFCLKYMKCEQVYDRHRKTCNAHHPPANEIYHKDDLSVFEVDGNINRIYCQNLCLLAKLFLDHKTLYYDVEPFLFYVLTRNDSSGCHFIGYFSKEKHCPQKYNLSCITVLPNCQRRGYGRFLIELSYLLSKKEGLIGTPERPLSTLGAQTYEAYWKIKIIEQLLIYHQENRTKCVIKSIMNETGMTTDDIIDTLQNLGVLTMKSNGKAVVTVDVTQLEISIRSERIKHAHWVSMDGEYLRFTPVLTHHMLSNEEKAVEREVKEIQIVFKEIGRDAAEAASQADADAVDGTEVVRYVRRRKFGQKRRSIYVKRRVNVTAPKSNKNESMVTNEDSCTQDTIINQDEEHSQEYIARRRTSAAEETIQEEEQKQEQKENENLVEKEIDVTKPSSPIVLPPKPSPKISTLKQLKLDQFLKVVRPTTKEETPNESLLPVSASIPSDESEDGKKQNPSEVRRINRHTRLQSETDQLSVTNTTEKKNEEQSNNGLEKSATDQMIVSNSLKEDSIISPELHAALEHPLPLKKRDRTTSDIPETLNPVVTNNISNGSNEVNYLDKTVAETMPDTMSQIPNGTMTISSSGQETNFDAVESHCQLTPLTSVVLDETSSTFISIEKTIKPVEVTDDETPPSLISPTSMIVSQSNHYNYSAKTRSVQQQQSTNVPMNNFTTPTNMSSYNYGPTPYPYGYPTATSVDMAPFYYPTSTPMNYMPFYPPANYVTELSPTNYSNGPMFSNGTDPQPIYYPSNGTHSLPFHTNGTSNYVYPTPQPSSTAPNAHRH